MRTKSQKRQPKGWTIIIIDCEFHRPLSQPMIHPHLHWLPLFFSLKRSFHFSTHPATTLLHLPSLLFFAAPKIRITNRSFLALARCVTQRC